MCLLMLKEVIKFENVRTLITVCHATAEYEPSTRYCSIIIRFTWQLSLNSLVGVLPWLCPFSDQCKVVFAMTGVCQVAVV